MQQVNWQRVRDILISIICIGIILWATWSLMGQFVHAIILLLLSMGVAFLLTPIVNQLEKYGLHRVPATIMMYIVVLVALGALCYALAFSLINQVQYFSNNLPSYIFQLPQTYSSFQDWLVKQGIPQANINNALSQIESQLQQFATSLVNNALNIFFIVTDAFINILLVAVLSFYFTLDGKLVRDSIFGVTPESWMPTVKLFDDALNRVVGNYIRGQLTLAAIIGILAGGGSAFLGLSNFALIIGVLAFLFETIPMVGPALASVPALLISLLLPDPFPRTFWIAGYFILVQVIESNILGPRIVGHAVGLHPIASILALVIGAQLFGAFGALLATPIVAAAWVVIASLFRSARGETADEILATKRSPWIRRRPHEGSLRSRRIHAGEVGTETSKSATTLAPVKGISGKIEHIDLMRPSSRTLPQQEQENCKAQPAEVSSERPADFNEV